MNNNFEKLNIKANEFIPIQKQDYEENLIFYEQTTYFANNPLYRKNPYHKYQNDIFYEKTVIKEQDEDDEDVGLDPQSNVLQYYNPYSESPLPGKYCPPLNREFTGIYVGGIPDEKMYQIIGGEGKVFKAISHQTGVDYIYWIKSEQLIAVWGYLDSLPYAIERLHMRIQLVLRDFKEIGSQY